MTVSGEAIGFAPQIGKYCGPYSKRETTAGGF